MREQEELYQFKITEVHEYYAWVPAESPEDAADRLAENDDSRIEIDTIRRVVMDEQHLGPATPRDRYMAMAKHAYLEAQRAAQQPPPKKQPRYFFNIFPLEAYFKS